MYFEGCKVFEYQTETDLLYETNLELKIRCERLKMECSTMAVRILDC